MNEQIRYYENKLAFEIDPSDLFKALKNREDFVVVDTRQESGYKNEHIPGALNLPYLEMDKSTGNLDPSKTYVCYCDGIGCNASTKGALKMATLGFEVKELIGGITWWKLDGYATEGASPAQGEQIQCAC